MKTIKFNPVSDLARLSVPAPSPARQSIPEWYKSIPAFNNGGKALFNQDGKTDKSVKFCAPFGDALNLGYVQKTWQEINISTFGTGDELSFEYHYPTNPAILVDRGLPQHSISFSNEFHETNLAWHPQWCPELPEGYSAIITHPLNRMDLPFYTLTGILDADSYKIAEDISNLPFLLKKDFNGIIPIGTPMYQIIPFKRDDWESFSNEYDPDFQSHSNQKLRRYFWGGYKKTHWKKKTFK